jgi:hypothetical protein
VKPHQRTLVATSSIDVPTGVLVSADIAAKPERIWHLLTDADDMVRRSRF